MFITPLGIAAKGVGRDRRTAGGPRRSRHDKLDDGVPIVTLGDLDVAGVAVPGFVRDRIQAEIDAQFSLAQDLPLNVDELILEEGTATARGTIR